ncbi:MAG: hypothetical protein ACI8T1_002767 [Verrucomicrobiales bacterium]|jgi:hypothetical protein
MQESVPVAILLKQVDRIGTRVIGGPVQDSADLRESVDPDEDPLVPEKRLMKPEVMHPGAITWIPYRRALSLWCW